MVGENICQQFRLKFLKKINNYFINEIDLNELLSKKYKKKFLQL